MDRQGWRVGYWMITLTGFAISIVAATGAPLAMLARWDWAGGDPLWRVAGLAAIAGWSAYTADLLDRRNRAARDA